LAYLHGRKGETVKADSFIQRLTAVSAERYVPAEYHALSNIGVNRLDAAFENMREAAARRSAGMVYLAVEPMLAPIRADPRFSALLTSTSH
jgi:hypothetical protein